MNPLCEKCKGACCETWVIHPSQYMFPHATANLVEGRRVGESADGTLFLNCRCRFLTGEGKCGIYEMRPVLCQTFVPLGEDCRRTLEAVRPELFKEVQDGKHGNCNAEG